MVWAVGDGGGEASCDFAACKCETRIGRLLKTCTMLYMHAHV